MTDNRECPKCGAKWINDQHYWATGKIGDETQLASLVCDKFGDDTCVNPKKGTTKGDGWANRLKELEQDEW